MNRDVPPPPLSVRDCLLCASRLGSDSARLDVETLLAHVLQQPRSALYAWPEKILDTQQYLQFADLLQQREQGVPVAYLTGEREFWSLSLKVNNATLIPRPDTELLVECALQLVMPATARVLDLGTGSGAVALALAAERPAWQVIAVDKQPHAVALAQHNARRCGIVIDVLCSDWFAAVADQRFALIVSNPPYIAETDAHLQQGDVAYEPRSALVSGNHGLDDLQHIVSTAVHYLLPQGCLLVEHGCAQGAAVRALFADAGFTAIQTHCDLGGHERVTGGVWCDA